MSLIQITRLSAVQKFIHGNSQIFVLKPTGEKGRKVLFKLDEIFDGCIFLEDVSQHVVDNVNDDKLAEKDDNISEESLECEQTNGELTKAPCGRKHRGRIDIETCKSLWDAGWSYEQIADEFGVKLQSAKNFISRHNDIFKK